MPSFDHHKQLWQVDNLANVIKKKKWNVGGSVKDSTLTGKCHYQKRLLQKFRQNPVHKETLINKYTTQTTVKFKNMFFITLSFNHHKQFGYQHVNRFGKVCYRYLKD